MNYSKIHAVNHHTLMRKNRRSMNDRSSHTVEQRGVKLLGVRMNHKTLKRPTLRVYYRDGKTLSSV